MGIMDMIEAIAGRLGDSYWERKVKCFSCGRKALLLKAGGEKGPHFYCLNCQIEGDIKDAYNHVLGEQ